MNHGRALQLIYNPKLSKDKDEFREACRIYRTQLAYVLCPKCDHNLISVKDKRKGKTCWSCWTSRPNYVAETLDQVEPR